MGCNKKTCEKHKRQLTANERERAELEEAARQVHRRTRTFLIAHHKAQEAAKNLPEMYFK